MTDGVTGHSHHHGDVRDTEPHHLVHIHFWSHKIQDNIFIFTILTTFNIYELLNNNINSINNIIEYCGTKVAVATFPLAQK